MSLQGAFLRPDTQFKGNYYMSTCSPDIVYQSMLTYDAAAAENYRRFINGITLEPTDKYKPIEKVLRKYPQKTLKEILLILKKRGYLMASYTLRDRLKEMVKLGIVQRQKTGSAYLYWLTGDKPPDTYS